MALNEHTARRGGGFIFLGIGYVGILLFLMVKVSMMLSFVFALLPFVAVFSVNRNAVFFLTICFSAALIGIPGIRMDSVAAGFLLQMVVLAAFFQDLLMRQQVVPKQDFTGRIIQLFLLNLIITAAYRGFGFYKLGGDMIGGMAYVQVSVGFLFFMYLRSKEFSGKEVNRLFLLVVACSAIPFVAQVAVVKVPALYSLGDFFVFSKSRVFAAMEDLAEGRGGRYETVVNFSYLLICLGTVLRSERKWWGLIFAFTGVLLLLLSGYRRYAVLSLFVFFFCSVVLSKRRMLTVMSWLSAGVLGLLLVYSTAQSLPYNIQRALAFLPGIQVGAEALSSGEGSFEWRMEIYSYCIEELPSHLLLGKGLLQSLDEKLYVLSYFSMYGNVPYFNFISGSYHNGIFELILTLGFVGFLSFTLLCTTILWRVWKHIAAQNDGSRLWRIMASLFSVCLAMLADYLLVRGEFQSFIAPFLLFFGLMTLAFNAHRSELRERTEGN